MCVVDGAGLETEMPGCGVLLFPFCVAAGCWHESIVWMDYMDEYGLGS